MNFNVIKAIFKRNFVSYFSNPTGYVFICVFVVLERARRVLAARVLLATTWPTSTSSTSGCRSSCWCSSRRSR